MEVSIEDSSISSCRVVEKRTFIYNYMTLVSVECAPMKKGMVVPEDTSSDRDRSISITSHTSSQNSTSSSIGGEDTVSNKDIEVVVFVHI